MMDRMNSRQRTAFDKACAGKNLVITGVAGTGKSFVIGEITRGLAAKFKRVQTLAFANVPADNVGGITIHSFLGVPVLAEETARAFVCLLAKLMQRKTPARFVQNLKRVDTLIIDEFGIIGRFMFTCLDTACRIARRAPEKPFTCARIGLIRSVVNMSI